MKDQATPFDVVNAWQYHRPVIEKALHDMGGAYEQQDVLQAILNGQMLFWSNDNAFVIAQVLNFPRKRYLEIFLAGGELNAVKAWEVEILNFAKLIKCDKVIAQARKGWTRDLGNWTVTRYRVEQDV